MTNQEQEELIRKLFKDVTDLKNDRLVSQVWVGMITGLILILFALFAVKATGG